MTLASVPVALAMLSLFAADAKMSHSTAGFARLAPKGLYMVERVYRRGDQTVRLARMIHVGDKEYYDDVAGSVVPGRTIVLAEGVTDDKGKLRDKVDYGKVANLLGLTSQHELQFAGRFIDEEAFEASLLRPREEKGKGKPGPADILRADVDVSAFRPETILFLNAIGEHLKENASPVEGIMSLNAWAEKNVTPPMYEVIMDDILHRRNKVLLGHMDKALQRYDTVVVPWGALHMKEIEAEVLKRGFVLQEERKRMSVDFGRMLAGRR